MKTKRMLTLLTAAVIWGFAFSAQVEAAQKGLGCFAFNGTRFVLGGLTLIPVVLLLERKKSEHPFVRHTLLPAMGAGVFLFVASTLQQLGINLAQSAGKASFITGLYIVLVPILSLLLFRKKAGATVWLGACLAVAGLYLLGVTEQGGIEFGDVLVLIGAFFLGRGVMRRVLATIETPDMVEMNIEDAVGYLDAEGILYLIEETPEGEKPIG
ncbi:MAG: DMT family transporter, partial [Clostridia bacterium]|nr:DMT family transporter [Clostridia bacterium]